MIKMQGKTYLCSACGWTHDEIDTVGTLGPLLEGFSDPQALRRIMRLQSVQRVTDALVKHEQECPKRAAETQEADDVHR